MTTTEDLTYAEQCAERLVASAAGLDLIVKAARVAGLPMPHTAGVTGHSRLSLQFHLGDLPVWAEWCDAPIKVKPGWTDANECHRIETDLLDVPVELIALVAR